jgi:hypothetical protein
MTTVITGHAAIEFAERNGLTVQKYNDPLEAARDGLAVNEARAVAAEDPALIYLDLGSLKVEAGKGDDHDIGRVQDVCGDMATVAWQSGMRTPCLVADLMVA